MNISIATISAFLSGSVITLIIKEVVNQINRKVDFDRELKKITFQRKIEKAENAASYYWTYLNKASELKKSLEIMHKVLGDMDNSKQDIGHVSEILSRTANVFLNLDGEKYFDVNGIHIYFDLEDEEAWNEQDLGDLMDCVGEMKFNFNEVEHWLELYNEYLESDLDRAEGYWLEMKKALPAYLASVHKFIDLIEKNRKAVHLLFKKIKSQLHE